MAGMRQNLRGRTVYGGNSFAPTRGPVSAAGSQGYIKREMRNRNQGNRGVFGGVSKFGRDGQSDTRSGIAAQALARGGSKWAGREGMGGFQGSGRGNPKGPAPSGANPMGTPWQQHYNTQYKGNGGAIGTGVQPGGTVASQQPAQQPGQPPVNVPQSVTINDAGQLELPYSEAWSQELLGSLGDYNQDLAALQAEQQQQQLQYAADKRAGAEGYEVQQRGTRSTAGARGVGFSSAHAGQIGNDARNYNNFTSQLEAGNTAATQGFDQQRTAMLTGLQQQMQQDALGYAAEVDDSAGSLGYGTSEQKVKPHKNPKKPPVKPDNKRHPKGSGWGPASYGGNHIWGGNHNWGPQAGQAIKKGKKK